MKNKKASLIVIIVLLVINVPLAIIGIIFNKPNIENQNPDRKLYLDGYIWFYNNDNELLSRYECLTEKCQLTKGNIDDNDYNINFYKDGTKFSTSVIDFKYAFITDGSIIHLFDINKGKTITDYVSLKNYNTDTLNDIYILEDDKELYGVLSFVDNMKTIIPFEYDFIGVSNNVTNDGYLNTNKFIVKKDATWYIVDNTNDALSNTFDNPIVYNNDKAIVTYSNNNYELYNFEGKRYLEEYSIKSYYNEGEYLIFVTDNSIFAYDNIDSEPIKTVSLQNSKREIEIERHDNLVDIILDGNVEETLEIK